MILLFLIAPVLSGCGKGDSGARLIVTTDTPLAAAASKPARSKTLLAATGESVPDIYPDRFLTPSAVTVGLKSFRFVKVNDTTAPSQIAESYTVLDTDPTAPRVIKFQTGVPEEIIETVSDPRAGTYDHIEYEITFLEMVIPLCDALQNCENRRLRVYLTGITDPEINLATTPFDLLLSRTENGFDFGWISKTFGISDTDLFPISGNRPADPVQMANASSAGSSVFSAPITLVVPRKPKSKYVFTLHFDLSNLFFFDNTDEGAEKIDPGPDFHFNARVTDSQVSRDGKVRRDCPPSATPCLTADFSAGFPTATVTVAEEKED